MSISIQIMMMMLVWETHFENHWSRWGAKQEWLIECHSTFNQWRKATKKRGDLGREQMSITTAFLLQEENSDGRDPTTTNILQQVYRDMKTWSQKRNFICLLVHEIDWDMTWFFVPSILLKFNTDLRNPIEDSSFCYRELCIILMWFELSHKSFLIQFTDDKYSA